MINHIQRAENEAGWPALFFAQPSVGVYFEAFLYPAALWF
jgi:hypothetical protein